MIHHPMTKKRAMPCHARIAAMQQIIFWFTDGRVYSNACLNGFCTIIGIDEGIDMNWDHMIATVVPYAAMAVAFLVAFGTFAAYFH